jgi:hypothetical protein
MAAGPDGQIWFTDESGSHSIGETNTDQTYSAAQNVSWPFMSDLTPTQGNAVTVNRGEWYGASNGYTYQWQDCSSVYSCNSIAGANDSTYTPQSGDVGSYLRVVVEGYSWQGKARIAYTGLSEAPVQ